MDLNLEDELFLIAIGEVESLAETDLKLAESVPWLRKMARQGADAYADGKLQAMETQPEREAWARIAAEKAYGYWGPDISDTLELPAAWLRLCAELHTWDMADLSMDAGPLDKLAQRHIQAVIEAVLFAFCEHIAEHYDW